MATELQVFTQEPGETCAHLLDRVAEWMHRFPQPFVPTIIHIDHLTPERLLVIIV